MAKVIDTPLVGREPQLRVLDEALGRGADGAGGAFVVAGGVGVGKSRLLAEAASLAADRGMLVLRGRAVAGAGGVAFRPVVEALSSGLRARPVSAYSLEGFRPALGRLLPGCFDAPERGSPDLVFVAEGVLRLLRLLAGTDGLLLALEDLHFADSESIALVEYLADNLQSERVVVAVALRDDHSGLSQLARSGSFKWVQVEPLSEDEVLELAARWLDGEPPPSVARLLVSRSDGVPLFIEELLAGLVSAGVLRRSDGIWSAPARLSPRLPQSFEASIGERVRALDPHARRVLAAGAVLGRSFDGMLAAELAGLGPASAARAFDACAAARLLEPDRDSGLDRLRFRHALTRDAVLGATPPPERRMLAEAALEAVESADPQLLDDWGELATELAVLAGRSARAVDLLRIAAARARGAGALASAVAALEQALELDPGASSPLLELVETLVAAGRFERVDDLARRILESRAAAPDARVRARVALAQTAAHSLAWDDAEAHVAAARAETAGAVSPLVDLMSARIAWGRYRFDEAKRLAQATADRALADGATELACEALLSVGEQVVAVDVAAAEALLLRALELAESEALPVARARALGALAALDELRIGANDRMLKALTAALEAGVTTIAGAVTHHLAMRALLRYELEEGSRWAEQTVSTGRRYRIGWLVAAGLVKRAWAAALAGDGDEAEAVLAEAEAHAGGDPRGSALMDGHVRVAVAVANEDDGAARMASGRAAELWWQHRLEPRPYLGLWILFAALAERGIFEAAEARLVKRNALWQPTTCGLACAARAVTLAGEGDIAAAEAAVERSVPLLDSTPWFAAVAARHAGERLLAAGSSLGEQQLLAALAFFAENGLDSPAAAIRAVLRRAGLRVPRRGRGNAKIPPALAAAGVSSREMDVLLLLADGLTNSQIAERLFLSPRTVEKHVERLLAKIGVRNRTALVARAALST